MSITLTEVTKKYGEQYAVKNISFEASKGEVVGFLGPNGAGKSTTMKMLAGYVKPTEGTICVNGIDVVKSPIEAQKKIGYLPEHNPLYLEMYVREYLLFQSSIHKVSKEIVGQTIEKVGLSPEVHKKISELSKGYRQRVGLAAAILHNPDVLILDEPTTGLDPNQLVEIRELIKEFGKDKVVLLSSHIMQEVEAVCDRVIVVNKGAIVFDKGLEALHNNKSQVIHVGFDYKVEEQFLKRIPDVVEVKNNFDNTWMVTFESDYDARGVLFDFAKDHELKILSMNKENKTLEVLFRELTVD